jgi:hypothetical protein
MGQLLKIIFDPYYNLWPALKNYDLEAPDLQYGVL